MTLSPSQIHKIYNGIPNRLCNRILPKSRGGINENRPEYPSMYYVITTPGIDAGPRSMIASYLISDSIRKEIWRTPKKARLTVYIESLDIDELDCLLSDFIRQLEASELGINPITDFMQYRGHESPVLLPPYESYTGKQLIQRYAIDFFVEYWMIWEQCYDVIKEIYIDEGEIYYASVSQNRKNSASLYRLSVDISR